MNSLFLLDERRETGMCVGVVPISEVMDVANGFCLDPFHWGWNWVHPLDVHQYHAAILSAASRCKEPCVAYIEWASGERRYLDTRHSDGTVRLALFNARKVWWGGIKATGPKRRKLFL